MFDAFNDYTFKLILFATTIFGITSAIIGSFAFVRKQSLLGDVISHATLPGLSLAFYLAQQKHPLAVLCGGALSSLCAIWLLQLISKHTRLKKDAALGIILSVFFGLGLVCLTWLTQHTHMQQGVIIKLIFGNAATLLYQDVYLIGGASICILTVLALCWKECTSISFDPTYAQTTGCPVTFFEGLLTLLTIICILVGLQVVGVVLMSTTLVAPAAAARQWTSTFNRLVALAAFFGLVACISGTIISMQYAHMPTGPVIAIIASVIVLISLSYKKLQSKRIGLP